MANTIVSISEYGLRKEWEAFFKKDLSAVDIWGISGGKIFLQLSHSARVKKKRKEQQVPSSGLDSSYYT